MEDSEITSPLTAMGARNIAPREPSEEEIAREKEYRTARANALTTLKEIMKDANVETSLRLQTASLILSNYF